MALLGLSLPGVLDRAVGAAAASGSPVALVALGVALGLTGLPTAGVPCEPAEEEPPPIPRWTPIIVAAVGKLLVLPLLAWFATDLVNAPWPSAWAPPCWPPPRRRSTSSSRPRPTACSSAAGRGSWP